MTETTPVQTEPTVEIEMESDPELPEDKIEKDIILQSKAPSTSLKRWLWLALLIFIGVIIGGICTNIDRIINVASNNSNDNIASSSSTSESAADGSSTASSYQNYGEPVEPLDCTPGEQIWNTDNPSAPFYTQEICDGLYAYGDGGYIGIFQVTSTGVIWVDSPNPMYNSLPNIVSQVTSNPITTFIYSHHHLDHSGAATQIPNIDTADIVCLKATNDRIVEMRAEGLTNIPECTTLINQERRAPYTVRDGDQFMQIYFAGYRWHTNNDAFIYAPKQQTVMAVDLVYPGWVPFKYFALATKPTFWRKAHDFLLDISSRRYGDWVNYVGGHVDRLGVREDVNISAQFFDDMLDAVTVAEEIYTLDAYLENNNEQFDGTNTWHIIEGWYDSVADACVETMEGYVYSSIFTDYDTFIHDHCYWLAESQRVYIA